MGNSHITHAGPQSRMDNNNTDLRAACEKLKEKLIDEHGHNPSIQYEQLQTMAHSAAVNKALGPLILFQKWLECNPDARDVLKEMGLNWKLSSPQ